MLTMNEVDEIVREAAAAPLARTGTRRIFNAPTIDSVGDEALAVTIVVPTQQELTGDEAIDAIVGIGHALLEAGEQRFPIIRFVTEDELAAVDDPES